MLLRLTTALIGGLTACAVLAADFQPVDSIKAAALGALPAGSEAEATLDPALRLPRCGAALVARIQGSNSVEVSCPQDAGWRLFVPVRVRRSQTVFVSAMTTPEEGLVNYPNPFVAGRDTTFLEYHLGGDSNVRLTVYDLMGQKILEREFFQGSLGGQTGFNRVSWDGRNDSGEVVGNGGYVAVLELKNEGRVMKRKIAVRK